MRNNDTMYLLIGAAVVGYFAYKQGLFTKPVAAVQQSAPPSTQGGLQSAQSVAVELPSFAETGIIAPKQIDITGEQLNFY